MLGEMQRYLIELRAVRSLLEVFRGIRLSWSCEEFVRRIARYLIELGVVRRFVRRNVGI